MKTVAECAKALSGLSRGEVKFNIELSLLR